MDAKAISSMLKKNTSVKEIDLNSTVYVNCLSMHKDKLSTDCHIGDAGASEICGALSINTSLLSINLERILVIVSMGFKFGNTFDFIR